MTASDIVAEFIAAIERGDIEGAIGHMAPDCEYDNVPIGKAVGHDAIRQTLAMFLSPENPARFEVVRQAATGNVVLNERVDHLVVGGRPASIAVAGVFEVDDATGKITLWRDYFDMGQFNAQLA
jgi:limonene-1,2-epoxide hydrolase